jgi:hypothetical protein
MVKAVNSTQSMNVEAARSCSHLFINTVYTLEDINKQQHSCENLVSHKDTYQSISKCNNKSCHM